MTKKILSSRAWVCIAVVAVYAPTLDEPFDFEDDGLIVHSQRASGQGPTLLQAIWTRACGEAQTIGPFRPVYWAYFAFQQRWFDGNPAGWRWCRLTLLALATWFSLQLFSDLGIPRGAANWTVLLAMIGPLRSSVWYRLGFGEGLAAPFALLALVAAVRGSRSGNVTGWDVVGWIAAMAAILTKNVFSAVVPAQILLRVWNESSTELSSVRSRWKPALFLAVTLAAPMVHVLYFATQVPADGHYALSVPSPARVGRMIRAVWLAAGGEFLLVGFALSLATILYDRFSVGPRTVGSRPIGLRRAAILACALVVAGIVVYVPALGDDHPAGRYTIPAVWGADLLVALLLAYVSRTPMTMLKCGSFLGLIVGGVLISAVNLYQQHEFFGRCRVLWQVVVQLHRAAPGQPVVVAAGALSPGEIVHLRGHLAGSGQTDLLVVGPAAPAPRQTAGRIWLITRRDQSDTAGWTRIADLPHPLETIAWLPDWARRRRRAHGVQILTRDVLFVGNAFDPPKPSPPGMVGTLQSPFAREADQ
jgi:hypothetical protein